MSDHDPDLLRFLIANGYSHLRVLPTGEVAGVMSFIYTGGLCVGLNWEQYRTRFCYPTFQEAADALEKFDGTGDPSGNWIKEKPADRRNPNLDYDLIS